MNIFTVTGLTTNNKFIKIIQYRFFGSVLAWNLNIIYSISCHAMNHLQYVFLVYIVCAVYTACLAVGLHVCLITSPLLAGAAPGTVDVSAQCSALLLTDEESNVSCVCTFPSFTAC